MQRVGIALLLAGCRLHFDDRPVDAVNVADAPPLALACNTAVKIADAPLGGKLSVAGLTSSALAAWIAPGGQLVTGSARLFAVDQAIGSASAAAGQTGFSVIALAADGDVVVEAATQNGGSFVRVTDATLAPLRADALMNLSPGGPRGVATTHNATGPIAAVIGNDSGTNRAAILPVQRDGALGTVVDSGSVNTSSTIVNIGDRLAIVEIPPANNCEVETADLAVTSHTTTVGWGTAGQCTEATLAYSPARTDALLVRHDLIDGDLNHVIATRSGMNYAIPGEKRLRNPADEPRPIGVADGYWVSYETGGMLEAEHVDFAGVISTPVVLGALADPTAHGTVVIAGEPYVLWVQDGLELAHLCR